jgi:hypothetical protein
MKVCPNQCPKLQGECNAKELNVPRRIDKLNASLHVMTRHRGSRGPLLVGGEGLFDSGWIFVKW